MSRKSKLSYEEILEAIKNMKAEKACKGSQQEIFNKYYIYSRRLFWWRKKSLPDTQQEENANLLFLFSRLSTWQGGASISLETGGFYIAMYGSIEL